MPLAHDYKAISVFAGVIKPRLRSYTPYCNRHRDQMHESMRVVNGPASIPGPKIPASVAVLQSLRQAFLSHKVIYTDNQRGPVSDC